MRNDITPANAVSERKKSFRKFDLQLCCVNKCETKKERQTTKQKKKHSRTSPDVQFKEFSLTKQKTRPGMNFEWVGKSI